MNHYPHHIGDFDRATRHLTRIERSVYRDLIDLYYDTEAPLTLDLAALCRRIIARTNEEATAVEQVLNEFFTQTEHGWWHERCEAEIERYRSNSSKKALAGRASALKKAAKRQQVLNGRSAHDEQPVNTGSTNQEPITNNQEPDKNNTPGKPAKFDPTAYLTHAGVNPTVIADWLKLRRGKQAAVTETALIRIKAQAELARMPLAEVLAMCCERGWAGFQAEWVMKNQQWVPSGKQAARDAYFAGRKKRGDDYAGSERDITGECSVIF